MNIDVVDRADQIVAAYNGKNFDGMRTLMAEDLAFSHFNRGVTMNDREEFLSLLQTFASDLIPDRRFSTPQSHMAQGNVVIRESVWGGTSTTDIEGLCEKGKSFSLKLCTVFRFGDDGLLVEWTDYG